MNAPPWPKSQETPFVSSKRTLKNYPVIPRQYISYQRSAYFGKDDGSFRLTFDRAITQRRFDVGLDKPNYGIQILPPGQYLMEVKIGASMPMWLSEQLAELGVYKTSFSKYGRAFRSYITETHTSHAQKGSIQLV